MSATRRMRMDPGPLRKTSAVLDGTIPSGVYTSYPGETGPPAGTALRRGPHEDGPPCPTPAILPALDEGVNHGKREALPPAPLARPADRRREACPRPGRAPARHLAGAGRRPPRPQPARAPPQPLPHPARPPARAGEAAADQRGDRAPHRAPQPGAGRDPRPRPPRAPQPGLAPLTPAKS